MNCTFPSYLLLFGSLLIGATSSTEVLAKKPLRYTLVLGGAQKALPSFEAQVIDDLQRAGLVLIDYKQSQQLRGSDYLGRLLKGQVPKVINSLDADLIVAAKLVCQAVSPPKIIGGTTHQAHCEVNAKLLAPDTAQSLGGLHQSDHGLSTEAIHASRIAARRTAKRLSKDILERIEGLSSRIKLVVQGMPDLSKIEMLEGELRSLEGITSCEVVHARPEHVELWLKVPASVRTQKLAQKIGRRSRLGLSIQSFSKRFIQARYDKKRILPGESSGQLGIHEVTLNPLLAINARQYAAQKGAGSILLKNSATEAAKRIRLTVRPSKLGEPLTVQVQDIPSQGRLLVPLGVSFSEAALGRLDAAALVELEMTLRFVQGKKERTLVVHRSTKLHGRNVFSWSAKEGPSAFVTSESPGIRAFAQDIQKNFTMAMGTDIGRAIAVHESIFDLRYREDHRADLEAAGLDHVQYPLETLEKGAGDCEDLVVLYAALLRALRTSAVMISVPGHVLVGLEVKQMSPLLSGKLAGRLLALSGKVIVPIETTRRQSSFREAWDRGLQIVRKQAPENIRLISNQNVSAPKLGPQSIAASLLPKLGHRKAKVLAALVELDKKLGVVAATKNAGGEPKAKAQ